MPKMLENLSDLVDFLIGSTTKEIEEAGFAYGFKDGFFYLSYKEVSVKFEFVDNNFEHVYVSFQGNDKIQDIDINNDVDDDDISQIILRRFNEIIVPVGERCLEGL